MKEFKPAIGVGIRKFNSLEEEQAYELWLPIFAKSIDLDGQKYSFSLETVWIFYRNGVKPEFKIHTGPKLTENVSIDFSVGFISGPIADMSVAIGPALYF